MSLKETKPVPIGAGLHPKDQGTETRQRPDLPAPQLETPLAADFLPNLPHLPARYSPFPAFISKVSKGSFELHYLGKKLMVAAAAATATTAFPSFRRNLQGHFKVKRTGGLQQVAKFCHRPGCLPQRPALCQRPCMGPNLTSLFKRVRK